MYRRGPLFNLATLLIFDFSHVRKHIYTLNYIYIYIYIYFGSASFKEFGLYLKTPVKPQRVTLKLYLTK